MPRYILAPAAERDIEAILTWSHEQFGEQSRRRYEALLIRAILDASDQPERTGSRQRPEIADAARTYHLCHSRDRIEASFRVGRPRHFLLYRTRPDGQVEIARVLHERMDLPRHLLDDYTSESTGDE